MSKNKSEKITNERSGEQVRMTARQVALEALITFEKTQVWSAERLSNQCRKADLDSRDSAFAHFLCGGVLRNRDFLDYRISQLSKIPLNKLERKILVLLRLGVFQILLADGVPNRAAVSETVSLVGGGRSSGFVNAILRSVTRLEDPFEVVASSEEERLAIRWSHPLWLVKEAVERFGIENTEKLLKYDNEYPSITIHTNTLKVSKDELRVSLMQDGILPEPHPYIPNAFNISSADRLEQIDAYKKGLFWVQDGASNMAVRAIAPKKGERILDVCAAPGGKSIASAIMSEEKVVSCDISAKKLVLAAESANRLGIDIETRVADASKRIDEFVGQFDCIICDVPCSGVGVIARKPDIRYKKKEELTRLHDVQLEILQNVSIYATNNGKILYSTCSWRKEENEQIIQEFLERNPDFETVDFILPSGKSDGGKITLIPYNDSTDGFFICILRKKDV